MPNAKVFEVFAYFISQVVVDAKYLFEANIEVLQKMQVLL